MNDQKLEDETYSCRTSRAEQNSPETFWSSEFKYIKLLTLGFTGAEQNSPETFWSSEFKDIKLLTLGFTRLNKSLG